MHEARIPRGGGGEGGAARHRNNPPSERAYTPDPSANRDGIEYLASRFQPFKVGFPINGSVSTRVSGISHRTGSRFSP